MRTTLKALALILLASGVANSGPLPTWWSVSAYNGYSVTFSCYSEWSCGTDASEDWQMQTEAQRICGRKKSAEFASAWSQYGASNRLFLCLSD